MRFKTQDQTILDGENSILADIKVKTLGGVCYHKRFGKDKTLTWTVTHRDTGLAMTYVRSEAMAKRVCKILFGLLGVTDGQTKAKLHKLVLPFCMLCRKGNKEAKLACDMLENKGLQAFEIWSKLRT